MATKKKKVVEQPIDDSKTFAFIATFLSIIGFIIVLLTKKDDKYVKFYAKQSLVVFIATILLSIAASILTAIFFPYHYYMMYGFGNIFNSLASLFSFLLWLISWIYALSGQEKEVPIVGKFARKFSF